jgi:hypothetical protein
MTPEDESELHRLTSMLSEIDATLPDSSSLREALQKSGLAISYAFIDGRRSEIEKVYENVDSELTDEQCDRLRSMDIDPDADSLA